ncbi:MAG: hypothetical protein ABIG93_02160 [archaeon]|nr:hypothetical protein [Nanoarchaeota archaeon]
MGLLYIHQLNRLSQKTADLESVYLIRELKEKTPFPIDSVKLTEFFKEFFVSSDEIEIIDKARNLIEPLIMQIKVLLQGQPTIYEKVNLQRTVQLLKEVSPAIQNSLFYLYEVKRGQSNLPIEIAGLLNKIPKLQTMEEKVQINERLKNHFNFLLRNPNFVFNAKDIINEGSVAQIGGLTESMQKGFFFSISLEEEYSKIDFSKLKMRIPAEELEKVARIETDIKLIKKGVDTAYNVNMKLLNLAVILYSYIKWLKK